MLNITSIQSLPGCGFGIKQSTLLVELKLNLSFVIDPRTLDTCIADWLADPQIASNFSKSSPKTVLERLMKFHLKLQLGQKIPVFDSGLILNITTVDSSNNVRAVIAIPYSHAVASRLALDWVLQAINALMFCNTEPTPQDQIQQSLQEVLQKLLPYSASNTNTIPFLNAAFDLGITTWHLWANAYGFGVASRMRRLQSSITDETSSMAVSISRSKILTSYILRQHGIPTPRQKLVANLNEALAAAKQLGYPVVIKPDDQEQGRGVSAGLTTPHAVEVAFKQANKISKNILLEKHHDGQDYRLTIFRNQVIKVLQRRPATVLGDGKHNIQELVNLMHQTPRYQRLLRNGHSLLGLDTEALDLLRERAYTSLSVPPAGEEVVLRRKSNISTGGTQTLIPLEHIHPDNLDLAIRACQAIQLDLCGVDLIAPDIKQSWLETGAVIIELNAKPQIGIAHDPGAYARILNILGEGRWTIPVQLVICDSNAPVPSLTELTALCGAANGIASPAGVWIDNRMIQKQPDNGFEACRTLLIQSSVHIATCCMTVDEVLTWGLPIHSFDRIVLLHNASGHATSFNQWDRVRHIVNKHTRNLVNGL